jgi:RNA 3'-terminal phosphate cyclase (ATP)
VASLSYLADATAAKVTGLVVGSKTLEFEPSRPPQAPQDQKVHIKADTAAGSSNLILQAVLPYLLFAGGEGATSSQDKPRAPAETRNSRPIEVVLEGGTNVTWSMSYEYLDQVTFPILELCFGIKICRTLNRRGWATGPPSRHGRVTISVSPFAPGQAFRYIGPKIPAPEAPERAIIAIDASVLAPSDMHADLQAALANDIDTLFPNVDLNFVLTEDSGDDTRIYVLLVARCKAGWRWARDCLYQGRRKGKSKEELSQGISRKVSKEFFAEIERGGVVDEHLQDQLVVFQALSEGVSSFPIQGRQLEDPLVEAFGNLGLDDSKIASASLRKDKTQQPFGDGTLHTQTARCVVAELLPKAAWHGKGRFCQGIGFRVGQSTNL